MQRRFRLTRSEDFKRVRRDGKSYAHPLVVLIVQANELRRVRVGVAAGKAVGTAVYRNRAKRLLREAMRTLLPDIVQPPGAAGLDRAPGMDLILIARPALASATLTDTRSALLNLLQRARLLAPHHDLRISPARIS